MFLSDTARTHRKLRTAGVAADLNVYEGMSHAEYLMGSRVDGVATGLQRPERLSPASTFPDPGAMLS